MFRISARTVLELGSELISSDIIAFYELLKNAFDAKSKTGADIRFFIVLRHNLYLHILASAEEGVDATLPDNEKAAAEDALLAELKADVEKALDPSAGEARVAAFKVAVATANTLDLFGKALTEAYRTHNAIEVIDTGTGMSIADLTDFYLTIGTPSRKHKVEEAIKAGATRTPYLGEKGIGRLSVMRLGDRLHIETARATDPAYNILDLDWRQFDDLDAMVEDIKVEPTVGNPKEAPAWSGTRLLIGDLKEDWTESRVRELASYDFARLTDPFLDPKKRPRVALFWNGDRVAIPWMDRTLIDAAHAKFAGAYRLVDGEPELTVRMDAINLGFPHPLETDVVKLTLPDLAGLLSGPSQELPLSALATVGPFDFESYWYNRRNLVGIETIGNQKVVRELQRKWSGILLFRDGFRVFPYGDDDDDWLGLDRRALGRPGYALNKAQFVGHVQISRAENPLLVDQTNREGLRANAEQGVFVAILQHVVRDMLWDFVREVDRRHRRLPLDLGDVKAQITSLETRARTALTKVRRLVPKEEEEVVEDLQHAFVEFRDLTEKAQKRIEEVEADGRQMVQMAGVGLMVEVVAHELARAAESALQALEALKGKDLPSEVKARLETLRSEMKSVSKRLRVLDQLSVSGRQRSEVFDIGDLLDDLREGHAAQFARHGIVLDVQKPDGPFKVRMVKGMIIQILENLLSNSIYWMQMRSEREKRFVPTITVRLASDPPTIFFSDNGSGIAEDHKDKIFRPFWSLKEKSKRRGLGLYIAKENAEHMGGQLKLSDRQDPVTRRHNEFVVEFPEAVLVR
ncbi:sensor histidine kinase [Agrobacterium rhizogenes]|nr:sensor histidine kinase [Rhizobium rhizogenes]